MTLVGSTRHRAVVIAGVCIALAGCGTSDQARQEVDTTRPTAAQSALTQPVTPVDTRSEPMGDPIRLQESVPNSAFQPDGEYKVVAGTIHRREIDGINALRALFSVYPPKGVELEPDMPNPQTIADGDDVTFGSCTYRFDIDEDANTVTLVPIEESTPGGCGAG